MGNFDAETGSLSEEMGLTEKDLESDRTLAEKQVDKGGQEQKEESQESSKEKMADPELIRDLSEKFMGEKGESIDNWIGGDPDQATEAHRFLFQAALEEEDSNKRAAIHLAHLQLELGHNNSDRVTPSYGNQIGKSGKPLSEVFYYFYSYTQMLKSGSDIIKDTNRNVLSINNEILKDTFLQFSEDIGELTQRLEAINDQDERIKYIQDLGLGIKEYATILSAQRTLFSSLGTPHEHAKQLNETKYKEGRAKLEDFFGGASTTCTEYAALAQQFLSFAGVKSTFISGNMSQEEDGVHSITGHAFLVFSQTDTAGAERKYIFDPTNPIKVKDPEDPTALQFRTFIVPLTTSQYESLNSVDGTLVEFEGLKRIYLKK